MWAAAACWTGVVLAEEVGWRYYVADRLLPLPACLTIAALLLIAGLALRRRTLVVLIAAGLALGFGAGSAYQGRWQADVAAASAGSSAAWVCEIVGDPQEGSFGASSEAVSESGGSVRVTWPDAAPEAGEEVRFFGRLKPPPRTDDGRKMHQGGGIGYLTARCVRAQGRARSLRGMVAGPRAWARARLDAVPGAGGALMAGVVLGDRRRLAGTQPEDDFRTTGLTHLVAVSGGHLVVVAAIATALLTRTRSPKWANALIVVMLLGIYVLISGVQPSAVRAWLMTAVFAGVSALGRRGDGLAALSWAAIISLVASPDSAFDLGLQLSVASVAGLLLFARMAEIWLSAALPGVLAPLGAAVGLTLVAQAATLPLTVAKFGMLSLVSPIANLVAGPIVSCVLTIGLAGLGAHLVSAPLGRLLLLVAGAAGNLCVSAAGWLARWPHAAIPMDANAWVASAACVVMAGALWVLWPLPSGGRAARRVAAAGLVGVALLAVGPIPSRGVEVVVLDVGQGDAILLRDGGRRILVDTGPSPGALREALQREGVRSLECVIVTHLHEDHSGGLEALEGLIPVKSFYLPTGSLTTPDGRRHAERLGLPGSALRELPAGTSLELGRMRLITLSSGSPSDGPAENEASVVVLVRAWSSDILLTGDAEDVVLSRLVAEQSLGDIDVLKVGHHGSAAAVSPSTLAAIRPESALISVGTGNRFGHPVASTLAELSSAGTRVLRTDLSGDLRVRLGPEGYSIAEQKRGNGEPAYATLGGPKTTRPENHGSRYERFEARLSDRERAGTACRPGAHPASRPCGRGRGSRFQLSDVRGRQHDRRRHHHRVQHDAVCVRAPPGGRAQHRQVAEGRA